MRPLTPDEKSVTVVVYTPNMFLRGVIILGESIRASLWVRSQEVLKYIHMFNVNALVFEGQQPKDITYSEMFVQMSDVVGYHLAPPAEEPLAFDTSELNRAMHSVDMLLGSFTLKGKIRISTQSDMATNLEISHAGWMSVYDADISSLYLPQFSMHVPMMLVNAGRVSFGIV